MFLILKSGIGRRASSVGYHGFESRNGTDSKPYSEDDIQQIIQIRYSFLIDNGG